MFSFHMHEEPCENGSCKFCRGAAFLNRTLTPIQLETFALIMSGIKLTRPNADTPLPLKEFQPRVRRMFQDSGILTFGALVSHEHGYYRRHFGIGKEGVDRIERFLARYGLELGTKL